MNSKVFYQFDSGIPGNAPREGQPVEERRKRVAKIDERLYGYDVFSFSHCKALKKDVNK